jgi:hypothetical protein
MPGSGSSYLIAEAPDRNLEAPGPNPSEWKIERKRNMRYEMKAESGVAVAEPVKQAQTFTAAKQERKASVMKALVFRGPNQIGLEKFPIPKPGYGEAVIRITLTTICGTDLHIVKGEYPVKPGLILGHEPVGVIHEIGPGVTGYRVGERVLGARSLPEIDFVEHTINELQTLHHL